MHFTPRPRWLMIVSIATVVLPVLRSPMISSRWPRPIGMSESIALMPVCIGSCTGLRPMMPGAWISMRRWTTSDRGPLPSTGSPSVLTTRPSRPSPTGTERMLPVARTVWPSSTSSTSPSTTAPIDSSSRLSARPMRPPSNSSSSFTAASGRPETRAMPSPTSMTLPTCVSSTSGVKPSRFFWIAARMSAVLMVSSAMSVISCRRSYRWGGSCGPFGSEDVAELGEAAAHRAVEHVVADRGDDAADHARVDDVADRDVLRGACLQRIGQAGELLLGERHRRADLGDGGAGGRGGTLDDLLRDLRQVGGPAGADDHRHDRHGGGAGLALEEVLDDLLAPGGGHVGVGQRVAELVAGLVHPPDPEQLVLHLGDVALGARDGECCVGVGGDAVVTHLSFASFSCGAEPTGRSVLCPDLADVGVDQALLRVLVERGAHDLLGGAVGQAGELAGEVGLGLGAGGGEVGSGALADALGLGLGARRGVAGELLGHGVGLLDDPRGLGVGVGQRRLDAVALRLGREACLCGGLQLGPDRGAPLRVVL